MSIHNSDEFDDDMTAHELDDPVSDGEPGYCPSCSGSGEGQYDGTRCPVCKGTGVEK